MLRIITFDSVAATEYFGCAQGACGIERGAHCIYDFLITNYYEYSNNIIVLPSYPGISVK